MTYELGTRLRKSLPVKTAGSHLRPHALRPIGDWKCTTERVDRIAKERHPVGVAKAAKQDGALLRRRASPEMPYYTGSVAAVSAGPVSYKVPSTTSRYATGTYRSGGSLERSYYSSSNTTGSSYLSRSTGSTSYATEYRSKFTSPARTSSSVPSYARSSSLSDDTSGRFSSTRDRTEPRRCTASTLTAADIISKYSPSSYISGGSTASDLGRPPAGSSRTSATTNASSASPISEDKDAGVTTRSSTLRGRAATVATLTSGGRVAAPSLERRSRVAKEVNGRVAASSVNNNASDSESSSSSSSPSRTDGDDNGNGGAPVRVSEIRRRFDASSSAASGEGASGAVSGVGGGQLAGGLAPETPRLHHGASGPAGGASSRRSGYAPVTSSSAAAPSPAPARKSYAPPAAASAGASSAEEDSEEEEDAKSKSEESSEEEGSGAAGGEGGDAVRPMTQPPGRRRPSERAASSDAGATGSPGERRAPGSLAAPYGSRTSAAAPSVAVGATGAYPRPQRTTVDSFFSCNLNAQTLWSGWRPSDVAFGHPNNQYQAPAQRRGSDYTYDHNYRLYTSSAVAGTSRDSDVLSVSPHFGRSAQCMGSERGGLSGLRNIGNTCFMNSVIQCLSNTKPLLEYLLGDSYLSDLNTTVSSMKGALIKAFSSVIKELWRENDGMVVNTTSLKSQIQRFAPRFMGYSQQDAQEFLRYLLEGLHEDVNRITSKPKPILTEIDDSLSDQQKSTEAWKRYLRMDDSKIVDIFVGQLKSTLRCTVCGHCSVTFDPFWDLSLPIPSRSGQVRLQQCLESFTREEVLDGDEKPTCAKCQTRRKCTKNFTIQKFPKILVLHLKRFSPTERFRGKLSVTVDFPHSGLDLSAYAASRGQGCIYNLYAISNHSGTTYSGHYTAYCRHPYTGDWHEYNDSRVSSISPRSIVSSEAYVLFYELSGHSSHL